ncbi:contractile injection system tape measure protein [Undibacterium sp. CY21W]|uniref:contractile injection system tape measure protein n=1 Tax=Undibacterium sp. CY21W TaxID=2762293 RepID=UPI00164AB51D|nr:contractile injection system tape measure protein [Undibacterium sp. CY21W]MBC3929771.1 hypothetical protein [Undibacterium sp. CY21W]
MRTSNLIHHLVFDLSFADMQTDGATSADWIKSSLLPVIDQVLDDICIELGIGKKEVKRIEKLEIDLGCILQAESESELARRLHAQLRNALYFQISDSSHDISPPEATSEAHQHLLDFLQTGQISWKYLSDRTNAHKKLLQAVLDEGTPDELLRNVVSNQRRLLRLIRQFDTGTLFAILRQELREWPEDNQDLLFDWLSLELITLHDNRPLIEEFWLSVLPLLDSADKNFDSVIQAWLSAQQKNKNQVIHIYQNFLEKNSYLSRQSRVAMNEAIQKLRSATAISVSSEKLPINSISDELARSYRFKIMASRRSLANAEYSSSEEKSRTGKISSPSTSNTSITENADDRNISRQSTTALSSADKGNPTSAASLNQLFNSNVDSIRVQHNDCWQQWLSEFPVTSCLDLIAVLQEHCSEYIRGQLKNNLHTLSKECLDQLVTYALSARVNSLEVADLERMLAGNRILATPFPKQVHGSEPRKIVVIEKNEATPEVTKKIPQSQILSALKNADIPRLSGLWNLLISKHPALILKLLPDYKIQWLDHFPLHFLSDIGRIVQTEASRVWQPKIQLDYHGQIDAATRAGFDILFTAKTQTLSVQSFIAKIKTLIQEQPSLAVILQSIVENATAPSLLTHHAPVTAATKLATTVVDNETDNYTTVSTLQSALCSNDVSTLSTAIEYALANDIPLLIRIRHQHWRRWWKNLPKHLLHRLILQLHASIRPELQAILQAKNGISFSTIERLIPLLLASPENSFSREQLNAIIALDEKLLESSDADNARLVTNTPIRNSGNTNAVPDELNELTIAFQCADIHRINAIWPVLIASHTRQLQTTWFSLTNAQRNTLIVQLPIEKQLVLIQILHPNFAHYVKELSVYATALANIISDNRATISLTAEKISANVILNKVCTFCLQAEPSSEKMTIKNIFMVAFADKSIIDENSLRRICNDARLADTKYLRHIFPSENVSLKNESTPLADSFRAWQQDRIQLQNLGLNRNELLRYLHWLMWHQNANEGKDFSLMLASIKEAEKHSSAPELFLQYVLEAIRNGENVDIESLRKKAENQPTTSRQQAQAFESTTDDPAENRPKNLDEAYFASANHETSATQPTLMENIELLNQVDQALLSETGWSDVVALLKRQPEVLTILRSAQLHRFISTWVNQAASKGISSVFLDEMENLALTTKSIRLFYINIIRQLLNEKNGNLPNLETLRGKLTEISTYAIDDLRQPPLSGLTGAEYIPTTKPDAATKDKASFNSQLLQFLSATSSINSPQPSVINSIGITGENWHAKQVSDTTNYSTERLPTLNKLAFRQWVYQWLNLTASSVLNENPSDELQLEINFSNTSTEIFTNLLQAINNTAPASIVKTFQEIADASFHLDKQFWSLVNKRGRNNSADEIAYQQYVELIHQVPWNRITPDELSSTRDNTPDNVTASHQSPLSMSTQTTLTGQLAHALLHSQLNKLSHIWPELIQYHGDLLAQAQRRYLRRIDLRNKLIADHDPAILKDLIAALSETAAHLLEELWHQWEIYRQALRNDMSLMTCQQKSLASVFNALLEQKTDSEDVSAVAATILTALTEKHLSHPLTQEIAIYWKAASQHGQTPHWFAALQVLFPETDWHKQEWQQQLRRRLKQSDPTATREFWKSLARHLERNAVQLAPANVLHEETRRKTDTARTHVTDKTTGTLINTQQTASVQTAENPDYIYQAMVMAALKLTKPSLLSSDGNVSKTANGTQAKQATLENWISQCVLLLQKHAPLSMRDEQFLNFILDKIFEMPSSAREEISLALHSEVAVARLVEAASCATLQRLCHCLMPELDMRLPELVTQIENALGISLKLTQAIFLKQTWLAIYRAQFAKSRPLTMQEFVTRFLRELCSVYPLPDIDICLQLLKEYREHTEIEKVVQTHPQSTETSAQVPAEQAMFNRDSYVMNAGLVIVAPYIQRLFGILELTKNSAFIDDAAAQRAIHLLQYIVTGEEQTPEYQLTLNKLLCGVHGGVPIVAGIQMTEHEKEVIQQMLVGVITHWSAIGKTSIQGLRETFLQREGHLFKQEESWQLHIPSATFDMLLDRLPWSFSMIKFPWMPEPLHVTWR